MFYQTPAVPWFRHIQTAEGSISNVVLLDNHSSQQTITHEIMHLYGLTDLYGTSTGPGRFSLMASNELGLLTYEKWVLGWHSDTDVKCLENVTTSSISQITFDYSKPNQLAVIRATSGSIYIVETTKVGSQKYLVFYSLDNEARPPLIFYQKNTRTDLPGVLIDSSSAIGAQFASTEFTLLISDLNSSTITMNLVSSSLTSTAQFSEIVAKASEAKSKQEADAKAAAELKAKQDADAKAAAELKAKQDADAKAAAELKAKQEADAKVAADIKAKQDADASARAAAAKKKTTITCIKGKTLKKVTAVQPKCPIGYKKR